MKWRRYPQYKDSGIEWLGEVPDGWELKRLKFLLSEPLKYGANESGEFDDPTCPRYVRITDISDNGYLREETYKSLPEDIAQPYILNEGDLLFARSGATVGKTFLYLTSWGRAAYAGYLIRARLKKSEYLPTFAVYFCRSNNYLTWLQSIFIQATIQNVSAEKYANLIFTVPPIKEQKKIAAFLDRETLRVDKLIEKKEKQIELLKEKRAALISHAVTKGLDPNVKMKDSGIEWLGEIPEKWGVRKLKHIASVKFSNVDKKINEGQQPVRICNYMDVYYNDLITSELNLMKASASTEEIEKFSLKEGDVLITKDSESWDDIAVPAYVSLDLAGVVCGYHLALVRPNTALVNGKYLFRSFYFQGINYQYRVEATGITRYGLGKYWLDNSLFLLPPKEEQQAIVTYLDRETSRIDKLIERIKKSAELLQEYRTAIISAAVTGKIDVRGTV